MLTLNWQGPIGIGNWPAASDEISGPKIYFSILTYDESVVVYIGRSKDFRSRLREHLSKMLGLGYWLRNSSCERVYGAKDDAFFTAVDDLPRYFSFIQEEISRWKFCYADCGEDVLNQVEAKLISHLKDHFPYEGKNKYWCENSRQEKITEQIDITMNIRCVSDISVEKCLQDCFGSAFKFETKN